MKNHLAIILAKAAQRYRNQYSDTSSTAVVSDYYDLLDIAEMIENNKSHKEVARAIWNLDTIVRDAVPDEVYESYVY